MDIELPKVLFHGTRVKNITQLRVSSHCHDSAHRDAVYLTESLNVASCYGAEIYTVELLGDPAFTLDVSGRLNEGMRSRVIEAMLSIDPDLDIDSLNTAKSADDIFEQVQTHFRQELQLNDTSLINRALLEHGIWMVFGYMHPMAASGLQDRGIQYALLDVSKSNILSCNSYESIWHRATDAERQKWRV